MKNKYLAKTNEIKTILEHTNDLLKQYKILKELYPDILRKKEWDILNYAVKYHDLGKMNTKFQNKLYEVLAYIERLEDCIKEDEIPHNFLSPFFIDIDMIEKNYGKEHTKMLVSAAYYHHARDDKDYDLEKAREDLVKQLEGLRDLYNLNLKISKEYPWRYILIPKDIKSISLLESKEYIMIKGLLNKLDYVASLDKPGVNVEESVYYNNLSVGEIIKNTIVEKFKSNYRQVQRYMLENRNENLIVIAPTGSGKTEAALLWIGDSKSFYTLPLKVSINAMYNRIYNDSNYKKAVLLHSDSYSYYLNNKDSDINAYDRARRLSSPLIVTTVDQLFKIAFKYEGYEEILSTLSYSKVIIDEIQMYSPNIVAYILIGLSMITKVGGKFAIVTATFPPVLYEFMKKLKIPYKEQVEQFSSDVKQRHRIQVFENTDIDINRIKQEAKNKKVLVIVNTVKKAQKIYEKLKSENVHLLHSNYIKKHRDSLENEILKFSNKNIKSDYGIWISTQIVEASLDIDFDILFTDMCSIDSLFQRMGRVYRKREYVQKEANIYIYDNKNGISNVIDPDIYRFSLKAILEYNNKALTEIDKQEIVNIVFDLNINEELKESDYYKTISKKVREMKDIAPNNFSRQEIQDLFRDISSISLIPDNIYEDLEKKGKIEEWTQKLNSNIGNQDRILVKEEIKSFTVSIRWRKDLVYDKTELFYNHSNIYRTRYKYEFDEKNFKGKGLIISKIDGKGDFDE